MTARPSVSRTPPGLWILRYHRWTLASAGSSGYENVGVMREPLDGSVSAKGDGDEIDPPDRFPVLLVLTNESAGSAQDAGRLGVAKTLFSTAHLLPVAGFDFDEDERRAVVHNEIELASPVSPVGGDEGVTLTLKKRAGDAFPSMAELSPRRGGHGKAGSERATGANDRRW
jgi:hypothetical protein